MDFFLFSSFNSLANRIPVLDGAGIFFARFAIFFLPFLMFAVGRLWQSMILPIILAVVLALGVNHLIAFFYFRARPFVDHAVTVLIPANPQSKSFPSDHAAAAFAIATSIALVHPKAGGIALAVAFLIGVSRIFVGVHYPSDVLLGILIGTVSAYAAQFIASRFL